MSPCSRKAPSTVLRWSLVRLLPDLADVEVSPLLTATALAPKTCETQVRGNYAACHAADRGLALIIGRHSWQ